MKDYELSDGNLSETQLTDKARKIKNQISDMEAEVSKLENNLAFFSNPTRENPLLKATYDSLDAKKKNWKDFAPSYIRLLQNTISQNQIPPRKKRRIRQKTKMIKNIAVQH